MIKGFLGMEVAEELASGYACSVATSVANLDFARRCSLLSAARRATITRSRGEGGV